MDGRMTEATIGENSISFFDVPPPIRLHSDQVLHPFAPMSHISSKTAAGSSTGAASASDSESSFHPLPGYVQILQKQRVFELTHPEASYAKKWEAMKAERDQRHDREERRRGRGSLLAAIRKTVAQTDKCAHVVVIFRFFNHRYLSRVCLFEFIVCL